MCHCIGALFPDTLLLVILAFVGVRVGVGVGVILTAIILMAAL